MKINSVNPVNQYQQRSQNFGMAVVLKHPEIPYNITKRLKAEDISKFSNALAKLTKAQESNKATNIVFAENGAYPLINITRMPDCTTLRTISCADKAYVSMPDEDSFIKIMEDAGQLADSYSKLTETANRINVV